MADYSKSFYLLNCEELESIIISDHSFSDFAGNFEIKNMSSLQSIQIGSNSSISFDFYYSPFILEGKFAYQYDHIDLPSLHSFFLGRNAFGYTIMYYLSNINTTEYLEIGDDKFSYVKTFYLNGLSNMKRLIIGKNSFTQNKWLSGNNKSKSFHILNCQLLEYIDIGLYSFSDYAGEFELKNLSSLRYINFANNSPGSRNFHYCPFILEGIKMPIVI